MATVLIQEGTLKVGSYIVCGSVDGKVRAMFDYEGKPVKETHLSQPVEVLGLSGTPTAGDDMVGVADDRSAKMVVDQRKDKMRKRDLQRHTCLFGRSVGATFRGRDQGTRSDNQVRCPWFR